MTIEQGVLLWGIRVVVPLALRPKVLAELHLSHMGIVKMKPLARQFVWWPAIDEDIEKLCKTCDHCCHNRSNPPSAPLHPWTYPEKPWQRVHVDLAGPFLDKMWIVLVDANTKWPEVILLNKDSTSTNVIRCLRQIFIHFSLPCEIMTDNGVQFPSNEFTQFCKNNGIRHSRSSVYHPRSNGEAERMVQTFKRSIKSSDQPVEKRLEVFLFTYRTTPHATTSCSPAEPLVGRPLRTRLDLIRPDQKDSVDASQYRLRQQFNKNLKVRTFQVGDEVWFRSHVKRKEKWILGNIVRQLGPVKFEIRTAQATVKRHVDHILRAEIYNPSDSGFPATLIPAPEESEKLVKKPDATVTPNSSLDDTIIIQPEVACKARSSPPKQNTDSVTPPPVPENPRRTQRVIRPVDRFQPGT